MTTPFELLAARPTAFDFFQAVRLLAAAAPDRQPVGEFGDPAAEIVRFAINPEVGFPASEIFALESHADRPPRLTVNFMGLTGPLGVLPLNYAIQVAERARVRDTALRDFFDMFNHRFISLFYKAWEKYRFTVGYERDQQDGLTRHLLDLVGLGTPGLGARLPVPDEAMLYYSGALSLRTRPAVGLEGVLADYFGVPVAIEQFVGGWYHVEEAGQCVLGDDDELSGVLGSGAVVGDEVWDAQAKVRLRVGPLTRHQYDDLLPTGRGWAALVGLSRFYVGDQVDVEVQLVLAGDAVRGCALGADEADAVPLGWTTWLTSGPMARDPDDTLLSLSDVQEAA